MVELGIESRIPIVKTKQFHIENCEGIDIYASKKVSLSSVCRAKYVYSFVSDLNFLNALEDIIIEIACYYVWANYSA